MALGSIGHSSLTGGLGGASETDVAAACIGEESMPLTPHVATPPSGLHLMSLK